MCVKKIKAEHDFHDDDDDEFVAAADLFNSKLVPTMSSKGTGKTKTKTKDYQYYMIVTSLIFREELL